MPAMEEWGQELNKFVRYPVIVTDTAIAAMSVTLDNFICLYDIIEPLNIIPKIPDTAADDAYK